MSEKTLQAVIQLRNDTEANWLLVADTFVPAEGEGCVTNDGPNKGQVKYGDGTSTWGELSYSGKATPTQYFEGTITGDESDEDKIAEITASAELNTGDVAVIIRTIHGDKKSYTAYVYNGSTWEAMDGNYDATNVYFKDDLIITANIGVQTIDSSGSKTLDTAGKNIKQVFDLIMAEEKNPTTTQPSVTVTSSQVKAYEVGTKVTPQYTATLNPGSYSYGPATGITATSWTVSDSLGGSTTTATGTMPEVTVADDTNYTITATATYGAGAVPVTNLGNPYEAGKIAAGSKTGTTSTKITGYRNTFYGTYNTKDGTVNSAYIRALPSKSNKALANGSTFSVQVPVGAMRIMLAYPATLRDVTSIKDRNGLNAESKSSFTLSTVSVEGANGATAIQYKVYTMDRAEANQTLNYFDVTI